jgi:hypothetical protein
MKDSSFKDRLEQIVKNIKTLHEESLDLDLCEEPTDLEHEIKEFIDVFKDINRSDPITAQVMRNNADILYECESGISTALWHFLTHNEIEVEIKESGSSDQLPKEGIPILSNNSHEQHNNSQQMYVGSVSYLDIPPSGSWVIHFLGGGSDI